MLVREKLREAVIFLLYKNEFEDIKVLNLKNESYQKTLLVIAKLEEIDNIISSNLENYTINRLPKLDLCIIRYAIYEMLYDNLDKKIAINEAVEISKKYSDINGKQYKFNNSLLDRIANGRI